MSTLKTTLLFISFTIIKTAGATTAITLYIIILI